MLLQYVERVAGTYCNNSQVGAFRVGVPRSPTKEGVGVQLTTGGNHMSCRFWTIQRPLKIVRGCRYKRSQNQ